MDALKNTVQSIALNYINETAEEEDKIDDFPMSIVDFVCDYAYDYCNFPKTISETERVNTLARCKSSLGITCADVYLKIGTEGQTSYSQNGISRRYKSEWIDRELLDHLPNYVRTI